MSLTCLIQSQYWLAVCSPRHSSKFSPNDWCGNETTLVNLLLKCGSLPSSVAAVRPKQESCPQAHGCKCSGSTSSTTGSRETNGSVLGFRAIGGHGEHLGPRGPWFHSPNTPFQKMDSHSDAIKNLQRTCSKCCLYFSCKGDGELRGAVLCVRNSVSVCLLCLTNSTRRRAITVISLFCPWELLPPECTFTCWGGETNTTEKETPCSIFSMIFQCRLEFY